MVKKNITKSEEDKFFKYFLFGVVVLIVIGAIYLGNNSNSKEIVLVNQGDVVMHYFYLETCSHCKDQEKFHSVLIEKFPNLKIIEYEMTKSDSRQKYIELTKNISGFDNSRIATPTTIIGNLTNVGYSGDSLTGQKLINMIEAEIEKNKQNQEENN